MTTEVFVDSGAFVAFLDRSDRQHESVRALFGRPPARMITSILVISETYTWFLHKLGEPAARNFREFLDDLPSLRILDADTEHLGAVWKKLDELRGRKLTFVDASALVCLRQQRIATVWGTDFDLTLEGAEVVPGPPI